VRYTVAVDAASVRTIRRGPRQRRFDADEECRSVINIEGILDKAVGRDVRTAGIYVFDGEGYGGDPGHAIGVSSMWQVVVHLPRPQFEELRAMVLADKLAVVDVLIADLSRGKGAVRTVFV
jgi:hypothetical protein